MVHCAREGSKNQRENNDFLTFGEFCIFATELRRYYDQHNIIVSPKALPYKLSTDGVGNVGNNMSTNDNMASGGGDVGEKDKVKKNGSCSYDVFLGGSCNPTVWRKDLAIPHFKVARKLKVEWFGIKNQWWQNENTRKCKKGLSLKKKVFGNH